MNDISAAIVVKDNPPHLFETLSSIQDFTKEIIIVDIGVSSTIIPKLKENKKIKIVGMKKNVPYVELIREEIKKYASQDYLLYLDPDEILGELLKKHLASVYKQYDYIKIPRKNIILGKWVAHSRWWPDYQVRLFKKNAVIWSKQIHQQPNTKGNGYSVTPDEKLAILHYNYESIDEFIQKMTRYAKSEANELTSFSLVEALKKALSEFMSRYFADEGYKDGMHGLVLAFLQLFYILLVYFYFWEKNHFKQTDTMFVNESSNFFKQGLYESNYWIIKKNLDSFVNNLKRRLLNFLFFK